MECERASVQTEKAAVGQAAEEGLAREEGIPEHKEELGNYVCSWHKTYI